ncbi:MAG: sulfurtransferase TusA family protein [Deltaproteobacteria bacterium]|nr:sulfurtransferase TusA family protein [Deltaproteobacteria bacterium]
MVSTAKLDLRGVVLPLALLNCSRALSQLKIQERMEVLVQDIEAADMLVKIVERSQNRAAHRSRVGGHYRIQIGPVSDKLPGGTHEKTK